MTSTAMACAQGVLLAAALDSFAGVAAATPPAHQDWPLSRTTANGSLRAKVFPRYTRAPATMRIEVSVEPARDNRALEFVVESAGYYRSSTIELGGEHAARVHSVQFRAIPAGAYHGRVAGTGAGGGVRAILRDQVTVYE
jgi:hypothetical protein